MLARKFNTLFRLIGDALSDKAHDFTSLSLNRSIFLLAVPMVFEMMGESVFAVVDVFFVSQVSVEAVATIGLTESMLTLIYSIAIGVSMAATAIVARRIGEKEPEKASRASAQVVLAGLVLGIVLGIGGYWQAENLLRVMGASDAVVEAGLPYTEWIFGGNIVIMYLYLINGIFRGAGNASLAMKSLLISNLLNIVLDPLLIFGFGPIPAMGLEGAAIATTIGRGIGVIYQFYWLLRGTGLIRIEPEMWKPKLEILLALFKISLGGTAQFIIASASWIFLVRILSEFGDAALAGYTIGIRIIIFMLMPAWGVANSAATLVGQNLGAGQPDLAEKAVWRISLYNMIFLAAVMVAYLLFAEPLVRLLTVDEAVIEHGVECLIWVSTGYIFYAVGMVIGQAFNGAGDTYTPTLLNFFGFWIIQIPLAYVLANTLGFDSRGVYWAIAISESILALASVILFKRGNWKKVKV